MQDFFLRGELVRKFMFRRAQGSTRFNLSKTIVKERLKIVIPSINEQIEISKKLEKIEEKTSMIELMISKSQTLQKSLINQIF